MDFFFVVTFEFILLSWCDRLETGCLTARTAKLLRTESDKGTQRLVDKGLNRQGFLFLMTSLPI